MNFSLKYHWSPCTGYTSAQPSLGTNSDKGAVFKQDVRVFFHYPEFRWIWAVGEGAENKENSFVKQAEDSVMKWNRINVYQMNIR